MYVSKRRKDSLHTKYKRFPSQRYLLILADLIKPCTQNLTNKKEMNNIKKEFWIQPSTLLTFSPFLPRKKLQTQIFLSLFQDVNLPKSCFPEIVTCLSEKRFPRSICIFKSLDESSVLHWKEGSKGKSEAEERRVSDLHSAPPIPCQILSRDFYRIG